MKIYNFIDVAPVQIMTRNSEVLKFIIVAAENQFELYEHIELPVRRSYVLLQLIIGLRSKSCNVELPAQRKLCILN